MQAEIMSIGTEIQLGQITKLNGAYMAKQLALLGMSSYHQQVLWDNAKRLAVAISCAVQRRVIVICMCGLGPTPEVLTKQTLAAHQYYSCVEDAGAMAKCAARVKQQQRPKSPNNRCQAMYPKGAIVCANRVWCAVGAWV